MRILIIGGAGYIGTALTAYLTQAGYAVDTLDIAEGASRRLRYQNFVPVDYNIIIHLAAHSSVAACAADPVGAIDNNLIDFADFTRRLGSDQTLLFVSTGSIHDRNTSNLYDSTKRSAEAIIPIFHPRSYVMRFGTVCGVSPKMREDLILNGMVRDAVRKNAVTVCNPGAWRPVLFFSDLCYAVERLLESTAPYGAYNLASFQARIGSWADMVARQLGVEIIDAGISPHYDFRMPILPESKTTPEAVINELAEYWRG